MITVALALATLGLKALGLAVGAFLLASLVPWLRDVWLTRHLPPHLPPLPFLGDLPELASKGMHAVMEERAARHGDNFRMFVGSNVWVVTADPESGRKLMNRLLNRFPFPQLGRDEALGGGRDLVSLRGERWRRMRLAWLPTFAPPSLALYAPLMDGCAKKLAARLEAHADSAEETDVWRLIGALTLDVVGTTAFGARFNALGGGDDEGEGDGATGVRQACDGDGTGEKQGAGGAQGGVGGKGGGGGGGDDDPASQDGQRLVAAARTIFANGSLTSGSGYQALLIMFPLGTPLWKWLAARLPDAKLREVDAAREVVRASAAALVRRQRRREAEAEAAEAEAEAEADAAAAANNGDADAGTGGGGARDQAAVPKAAGAAEAGGGAGAAKRAPPPSKPKKPSAISNGILPGSFLANMLRPQAAAARPGAEALPPPSEADAVANASLFVLAGYETTANTLACAVFGLATNPAAQRRLCAEVDAFFAAEGRDAPLTPEAVAARFPYCEAAIKEALRLYSPVTAIAREVAAPPGAEDASAHRSDLLSADAPALRPGITVAAANWVYQRSERYWPRALDFLPERWIAEEQGGAASVLGPATPSAWSPFGGGPRQCVGIKFAMLEACVALVRLYERYTFAPGPSQRVPLPMKQALTLSPDGGVNVVVRRRPEFFDGGGAAAA